MVAELVIADQHAIGIATEGAIFLFIDFLKQGALIELGGFFQVHQQVLLADIEEP